MTAPAPAQDPTGRLLKMSEVVRETSLHRATIYRHIAAGNFPKPIHIGRQRVAWRERDLENWKAGLPVDAPA